MIVINEETKDGDHRSRNVTYTEKPIEYTLKDGTLSLRGIVHCTAVEGIPIESYLCVSTTFWTITEGALRVEGMQQEFTYIEQFFALLTGTYYSLDWPQVLNGKEREVRDLYALLLAGHGAEPKTRVLDSLDLPSGAAKIWRAVCKLDGKAP